MADLLSILSQSASSLAAQTAAQATTAHNLQNANTPGYARQTAVLATTIPAEMYGTSFIGQGATLQTVTQARDRFVEAQLPALQGNAASSTAQSDSLQSISALDPTGGAGLGNALTGFYGALRALSQSPADPGLRQAVVSTARSLALTFQATRGALEGARSGVDSQLAGSVGEVNSLAGQVATLNGQIRAARAGGAEPNDLLDARQKAVDRLAELTGIAPVNTSEGDVSLALPGGAPLVTGLQAFSMSTVVDAANGGHLAMQLKGPGGSTVSLTGMGGQLGGLIAARDGAIKTAVDGLDAMAWDFGNTLNGIHQAGYGLDGTNGDPLFTQGLTQAGAAGRIDVAANIQADPRRLALAGVLTSPTSAATGDIANLQRIIGSENTALATSGLSAASSLSKITSDFGAASQSADALSAQDAALRDHLNTMREATSGVSIDDELVKMQQTQRAYMAISKVIQTASDMFDALLAIKPA